jgi:hypothetical protein
VNVTPLVRKQSKTSGAFENRRAETTTRLTTEIKANKMFRIFPCNAELQGGLTDEQLSALSLEGESNLRKLWKRISDTGERDGGDVFKEIAAEARAEHDIVVLALSRHCAYERNHGDPSPIMQWLPQVASAFVIVLFLIPLYNYFAIHKPFGPIPSRGARLVVATKDLQAGHVLRNDDVMYVKLHDGTRYFKDLAVVEGLQISHDLMKGRPLCFEDVNRPQMVAAIDLGTNKVILTRDVSLKTTVYDPAAFTSLEDVVGRRATKSIASGVVLIPNLLASRG